MLLLLLLLVLSPLFALVNIGAVQPLPAGKHCQYQSFWGVHVRGPNVEVGSHEVPGHGPATAYAGFPDRPPHLCAGSHADRQTLKANILAGSQLECPLGHIMSASNSL